MSKLKPIEVDERFDYQGPSIDATAAKHNGLLEAFSAFGHMLDTLLPDGEVKPQVIRTMQKASKFAHMSVNELDPNVSPMYEEYKHLL